MGLGGFVQAVLCLAGIALSAYALNVEIKGSAAKAMGEEYEVDPPG